MPDRHFEKQDLCQTSEAAQRPRFSRRPLCKHTAVISAPYQVKQYTLLIAKLTFVALYTCATSRDTINCSSSFYFTLTEGQLSSIRIREEG